MFNKLVFLLVFLATPLIAGCAHTEVAQKARKLDNCRLISARAAWQQNTYEAQYSALLATCDSADWRLLLKADWGTTAVDIAFINGKLAIITKPAPLSGKILEALAEELSRHLSAAIIPEQIAINLPENSTLLELNKLSERLLPEAQAQNLFNL